MSWPLAPVYPGIDDYLAHTELTPLATTAARPAQSRPPGRLRCQHASPMAAAVIAGAQSSAPAPTADPDSQRPTYLLLASVAWAGPLRRYWGFFTPRRCRSTAGSLTRRAPALSAWFIVHGNHSMTQYSDAGFAYLAAHLASRGMIAVSVDENFVNGFLLADGGGQEMPLRGWLLLEHLQQWGGWNALPGNPFTGRVDLARIALRGHSRGGEAMPPCSMAAVPAASQASPWEFDFGIRAVVGIAPSDGQFLPNDAPLALGDISYLMLVGGHEWIRTRLRPCPPSTGLVNSPDPAPSPPWPTCTAPITASSIRSGAPATIT